MDSDLTKAALECARSIFGDVGLVAWTPLTGSQRSTVARMALITDAGARTVIVKSTGGNARERAALEVLSGTDGVPRLLGVRDDPPLLLLEDVGAGPSVADRLLGDDRAAAVAAVEAWAESVAGIQTATLGLGPAFADRLVALSKPSDAWTDSTPDLIDECVTDFERLLPSLGAGIGEDAAAELRAIGARLRIDRDGTGGPGALTPGDACPDNNISAPGRLVLIDFEWAEFRHVAWEAAYLAVPWPTCWCSWRMPAEVTASALARWRETLIPALDPAVAAGLDEAVREGTTAWALLTSSWLLPLALGHDAAPPVTADRPRPEPEVLVQYRLSVAAASAPAGPLRTFATEALATTRRAWGEQPLPLGPVWR